MSPKESDNQQPQAAPVQQPGSANPQYGPAPVSEQAPYQQQPVNQQYFAQPQAAPVQYVVMAQSLKGVRGWLLFFVICFGLAGIGYISAFFLAIADLSTANSIVSAIFSPILAVAFLGAAVLITMQKQLGRWLAAAALGIGALYSTITSIVNYVTGASADDGVIELVSGIVIGLVLHGLLILYFFASKRVKETLVG